MSKDFITNLPINGVKVEKWGYAAPAMDEAIKKELMQIETEISSGEFREIFFDTLQDLPRVPNFNEVLHDEMPDKNGPRRLKKKFMDAQAKFNEEFWAENIEHVPVKNLIHMAHRLQGAEIPKNFIELFKLHPNYDEFYREDLRIEDRDEFPMDDDEYKCAQCFCDLSDETNEHIFIMHDTENPDFEETVCNFCRHNLTWRDNYVDDQGQRGLNFN